MGLTDQGNMVMDTTTSDYERQKIQEEINRIRMGTR